MIRRPPRSTLSASSAAADGYKRQDRRRRLHRARWRDRALRPEPGLAGRAAEGQGRSAGRPANRRGERRQRDGCLLYTSDAADEEDSVDLGGRRIIKKKT